MTRREAKRVAKLLCVSLIRINVEGGWPFNFQENEEPKLYDVIVEEDGNLNADGERINDALSDIMRQLLR